MESSADVKAYLLEHAPPRAGGFWPSHRGGGRRRHRTRWGQSEVQVQQQPRLREVLGRSAATMEENHQRVEYSLLVRKFNCD